MNDLVTKKYLSQADKAEIIRLRIEDRMSGPEIARRIGSKKSSVYEIIKPFPLTNDELRSRKAKTAEKMRAALQASGHYIGGAEWSGDDEALIRKLWPNQPKGRILAALRGRSWHAISKHAAELRIRRNRRGTRDARKRVDKFFRELREIREARGILRDELAQRAGIGKITLANYELGGYPPSWPMLRAWLGALGYDICAVPAQAAERSRGKRKWLGEEESMLRELLAQGSTLHEISLALKRPAKEIQSQLQTLGLYESERTRNVSGMTRQRLS